MLPRMYAETSECLLSYGITTNPDPIQVSSANGTISMTSIVITVSNNSMNAIYCNQIKFSFPIGNLAQDLASSSSGILMAANPSDQWNISMTSDGVFTATPVKPSDNLITTDGISFQIFNIPTNTEVGTFTFSVAENSSADNKTFTNKNNSYDMSKFPYGFYMDNFAASAPYVEHGDEVTLTWNGSDLASYTMYYNGTSEVVTNTRSWKSPNLTETTTFALKASVQEQSETANTYLYLTVIVSSPDLVGTTLTVSGASTLNGPTTVNQSFVVTGTESDVVNLTTKGTLNVKGSATLTSATTSGTLTASGAMITNGSLTANNQVSMFKAATCIASGTSISDTSATANTDGFLVAQFDLPNHSLFCAAWAAIYSEGEWFQITGGNSTYFSSYMNAYESTPNTMCIPVRAGQTFQYSATQYHGNQDSVTVKFYLFSFGKASTSTAAYEVMETRDPSLPPSPEPQFPPFEEMKKQRQQKATGLINALEKAFGKNLSNDEKDNLSQLLTEL